ncbi:hypothetical protein PCC7424_4592 [Gloeothece citriformis PCC 7424]|uniref:Uncharacterized protein n=1 Tax=Gloeothece citriformis (strain PCC 7424) TaxID=65393 RepID=B7KAI0_GLOC7|nr:choice-of-anchor tandem repeat NxxGxxAF-containing protein [Gloeothece citriformis]ACK72954.1 hypothetical protein PCC7424_4592 [Gloeothece citriformis PCC 7424]
MNNPIKTFSFTKIAENNRNFDGFEWGDFQNSPAINDKGTVAFDVNLLNIDGVGIFTGDGKKITREYIATPEYPGGPNASSLGLDINNKGILVFSISDGFFDTDILVSRNGEVSAVGNGFLANPVSINNRGTVAFAQGDSRNPTSHTVETVSPNGQSTIIASSFDEESGSVLFAPEGASINDRGQVAFKNEVAGIFVGKQGKPTNTFKTIADGSGQFDRFDFLPDINNKGIVAFSAKLDDGSSGIFLGNTKKPTNDTITIVDSQGLFDSFQDVALSDKGEIAFEASLDTGEFGIFTGDDPIADKVIAIGDLLFGSTVTGLDFFIEGLNNSGQIAFSAELENGTEVVVRANPTNPTKDYLIEAENFNLETYKVENTSVASNGKLISLLNGGNAGSAATQFTGNSGYYDILVGYYDEIDGKSLFNFKVNNYLKDQWKADQKLDPKGYVATRQNFTEHLISGISLQTGDILKLEGFRDQEEYARIDYLKLIPSKENRRGLNNLENITFCSDSLLSPDSLENYGIANNDSFLS